MLSWTTFGGSAACAPEIAETSPIAAERAVAARRRFMGRTSIVAGLRSRLTILGSTGRAEGLPSVQEYSCPCGRRMGVNSIRSLPGGHTDQVPVCRSRRFRTAEASRLFHLPARSSLPSLLTTPQPHHAPQNFSYTP